jgi:hypothetical protein
MVENCYNYENVMGRGEICASFPLSLLSSNRQELSGKDDLIAEKRRKRTVARFVALTTSAADEDCSSTIAATTAESQQTLDRIIREVTDMEEELLTEYKPKILNTREVRSDELVAKFVEAVKAQIPLNCWLKKRERLWRGQFWQSSVRPPPVST